MRRARAFLLLAVVLMTGGSRESWGADAGSSEDRRKSRSTEEFMRRFATALEDFAVQRWGRYPATTAEADLRTLLSPTVFRKFPPLQDEWGTPLRVEVTKDRQHVRLVSAGADRRFETYAPLDASVPPRKELDDPAGDIVFVDGEIVQGLKPLPPPEPKAAALKAERLERSRKLAEVLAAKNTACASVDEEAVLRLLPAGSDAVRTPTRSGCGWSWWPDPAAIWSEMTFTVNVWPGRGGWFHDLTTGPGVPPPPPPPRKGEPEPTPRPTPPPHQWTNVEGVGDEARWDAPWARLYVRKGGDIFIFEVVGGMLYERRPLAISLASAALTNPGKLAPNANPVPRR